MFWLRPIKLRTGLLVAAVAITNLLLCNTTLLHGQPRERHGYISISAGPTWLPGAYFDNSVGLQVNLLEFGYDVSNRFGVAATWVGAAFSYEGTSYLFDGTTTNSFPATFEAGYGLLALGPMYSIRISRTSSIDLKARVGRYFFEEVVRTSAFNSTSRNSTVGYLVSATFQERLNTWWSVFASLDYGNGRKPITMEEYQSINSLAVTVGIGLRL